jgi:hypothetical protein
MMKKMRQVGYFTVVVLVGILLFPLGQALGCDQCSCTCDPARGRKRYLPGDQMIVKATRFS